MATLITGSKFSATNASGAPLAGGKVYTYAAGTLTPLATYTDQGGLSSNANPVILDASGRANIWLGAGSYRFIVKDASDVLAPDGDVDNIAGMDGALAASSGSSLVGFIQAGTGAVARTVQARLRDLVSVKDFGAVGNGSTDDTAAIQSAIDSATVASVYFPPGTYKLTSALSLLDNKSLIGAGIGVSKLTTPLNVEMVNANASGSYDAIIRDIGFYNTYPVADVAGPTPTGTTTNGSATITAVSSVTGLYKGMKISGTGIPAGSFIRKFTAGPNVIYLCNSAGAAVNATSSNVATLLTTNFREGSTKFHIHAYNAGRWLIDNCYFKSSFVDSDYSPNNHGGVWFDRASGASYFINEVINSWFDHAQLLMGTSDSNVKANHIWGNPFDYALKLSAPGIGVVGNNLSAGQTAAIYSIASGTEAFGGSNHNIVGNNIDGGGIFYSGYGLQLEKPVSVVISGNRINQCFKAGLYLNDSVAVTIDGNNFLDNNLDGLGYSDIEASSSTFQSVGIAYGTNTFYQSGAKSPTTGYAIREINNGFFPANCSIVGNVIAGTANYQSPAFSIATTVASGQYPKISGNTGGSTETESTANTVTNNYTGTLTGCTTSPTATVTVSRQGNLVTLTIPTLSATSNTTACTITGMPVAFRPATQQRATLLLTDNGVNALGYVDINTDGTLALHTNTATGVMTNVNAKGAVMSNVTYQLVS